MDLATSKNGKEEIEMIAKEIKEKLKSAKIPYWRLAKEMNVSENTVWRMLRDDSAEISVEKATEIAKAFAKIVKEEKKK